MNTLIHSTPIHSTPARKAPPVSAFERGVWTRLNGGSPHDNPYRKLMASENFRRKAQDERLRDAQIRTSDWARGFARGTTRP